MTGQTMISAAFFVLLTMAVLSANTMILESNKDYLKALAVNEATNFANSLISEVLTKKFDGNITSTTTYYAPSAFADPTAMGATAADRNYVMQGGNPDVVPYRSIPPSGTYCFDDVDDYDTYERTADAIDIKGYHLKVSVYYISINSPTVPIRTAGGQTYYKRIDVSVDHPLYLPQKLTFSAIATY